MMPTKYAKAEDLAEVKEDVHEIRHNELPHLRAETKGLSRKVYYILGALAVLIPLVVIILERVW